MDAIRISNLVKKYGNVVAVDNLSLAVPEGALFGFLGPNGSGKSTTIGCLTGILDPAAGAIEILGQPFDANSSELKRRIGVMPETIGHLVFCPDQLLTEGLLVRPAALLLPSRPRDMR